MKTKIKLLLGLSLSLAAIPLTSQAISKAAGPDMGVLSDKKASMTEKVGAIDAYVRSVEQSAPSLTRKEAKLSEGELKKVTDENWTKIHTYSDGTALKRMKMYPAEGSKRTEEFYYYEGKPVFVFVEENGVAKENHDANAKGEKYYFANGQLIGAMSSDGKEMDLKSAAAKKMAEKLKKESAAFRADVK